jgi:hypothetical protein
MRLRIRIKFYFPTALFIENNDIQKIELRHRVTLMQAVSHRIETATLKFSRLCWIPQYVSYKTFVKRSL